MNAQRNIKICLSCLLCLALNTFAELIDFNSSAGVATTPEEQYMHKVQSLMVICDSYIRMGNTEAALRMIEEMLAYAPRHPVILMRAYQTYSKAKKFDIAETYAATLAEQYGEDPVVYTQWAEILLKLHNIERATELLTQVLKIDPNYSKANYCMAIAQFAKNKDNIAQRHLRGTRLADITDFVGWVIEDEVSLIQLLGIEKQKIMVGYILSGGEKFIQQDAVKFDNTGDSTKLTIPEILEWDIKDITKHLRKLHAMLQAVKTAKQDQQFAEMLRLIPTIQRKGVTSPVLDQEIALATFADGDQEEAMQMLREFLQANPKRTKSEMNIGILLLHMGNPKAAKYCLQNILNKEPENKAARFALACALTERGEEEDARKLFSKLATNDPNLLEVFLNLDEPHIIKLNQNYELIGWIYEQIAASRKNKK